MPWSMVVLRRPGFTALLACSLAVVFTSYASISAAGSVTPDDEAERQPAYLFFLTNDSRLEAGRAAQDYARAIDATQGDAGKLGAFYREAMRYDGAPLSEQRFVQSIETARANFNKPSDRVLESVDGGFRRLPGYPNGQYAIVSFDVRFSGSSVIYTEQLTLERVPVGAHWRLVGYFIGTKPFYRYE